MDDLNINDDTDPLVQQWSETAQFSSQELEQLSADICRRAALETRAQPARRFVSRSRIAVVASLVAATAAMLAFFVMNRPHQDSAQNANLAVASSIPWERMHVLASECGRLFDHRVAWLAETDQDLSMGVDEDVPADDSDKKQIKVRIVVFHRQARTQDWKPIFTTNIITREEEVIELKGGEDESRLRLWTHILPDQAVAVDSELSLGKGKSAPQWVNTSVLSEIGSAAMLPGASSDGEYQVWQSAAVMKDNTL